MVLSLHSQRSNEESCGHVALAWDWPSAFALELAQSHPVRNLGWLRPAKYLQSTPATPARPHITAPMTGPLNPHTLSSLNQAPWTDFNTQIILTAVLVTLMTSGEVDRE